MVHGFGLRMLGVFAAFSAELCAQVVAVEPARDSAARTSSSRVDTLRDKMSDALIVRAGVIASPSERIWSAFVGMACVIPRKSRETVLLVDPEVAWGTATTYGAPSAGTRGHRGDDKPLPYIWQRYDTRSGQGSAPQLVQFVATVARNFQRFSRLRVELPLLIGGVEIIDFSLGDGGVLALQKVFDHCQRKLPAP